jgi:hypothetical protein
MLFVSVTFGLVWQTTQTLPLFFFQFSKKKNSNFFTLFISHQSFFIIIQIKKPTTKQNFFHFFIKHSQILYHINHFLLHNTQIFHNTITYQISLDINCRTTGQSRRTRGGPKMIGLFVKFMKAKIVAH